MKNQDGKYVYVLTADNTVDVRVIWKWGMNKMGMSIMTGLNEGEQLLQQGDLWTRWKGEEFNKYFMCS